MLSSVPFLVLLFGYGHTQGPMFQPENFPYAIAAIHAAIAQWERKTCIRFVPYTNQKFHLTFFRNTHCWGNVGQVSYSRISVGPGCEYEHVMAHEIGHVVESSGGNDWKFPPENNTCKEISPPEFPPEVYSST